MVISVRSDSKTGCLFFLSPPIMLRMPIKSRENFSDSKEFHKLLPKLWHPYSQVGFIVGERNVCKEKNRRTVFMETFKKGLKDGSLILPVRTSGYGLGLIVLDPVQGSRHFRFWRKSRKSRNGKPRFLRGCFRGCH